MVLQAPPTAKLTPNHIRMPAGTRLFRVHSAVYPATAFKYRQSHIIFGGGRFDGVSAADPYPFLYACQEESTALAEVMLRGLGFNDAGTRLVPPQEVVGRRLTPITLRESINLISLETQQDLAAIGQDQWLVNAGPDHYAHTRAWGRYLRRCSSAPGILWQSLRDRPNSSMVLFGDRCKPDLLDVDLARSIPLDSPDGLDHLNDLLSRFRTAVDRQAVLALAAGSAPAAKLARP